MDASVGLIADYADALAYSDIPASTVRHCKRCVIDAVGCALGAFHAKPSRLARAMAERTSDPAGSRVLGTSHRTLPELATFANGVMVRYLDANDAFTGNGGHPSDTLSAVLAAADLRSAGGKEIITSIALAYEIYHNLWKSARVRDKGIDHVFYTVIGGSVGAAKALGLNRAQMVEAISLAITPNLPLDATRYGHLGMWKGCAAGNAARNAVFAVLLAQAGMTGPEKPIDGDHGLQNLLGRRFELLPFPKKDVPFGINEVTLKSFFVEGHALTPIAAALELCKQVAPDDIEKVSIYSYHMTWKDIGSEPERWRPTTRESADHSLPYIIAAVLVDQKFSDAIFADERLNDARIHAMSDKIEVEEDPELTRQFPQKYACRMEITTKSGERKVSSVDYARGHFNNPMTDDEVSAKFRGLAQRALPEAQIDRALKSLWQLDNISNLDEIFDVIKIGTVAALADNSYLATQ